MVSLDFFN